MPPRIRLLSDHLVSQIAAGEVVERPASVVKELIENSLDAGARDLGVELSSGGKRRIRVSDDGEGMEGDDALLAFDRHATSKIATFEELQRVGTLGFRGEALATIGAVARVELLTAQASGEGTRVRLEGGRVRSVEPAARARGTTLDVASLFYNVPARRKFLKSPRTELRRALEVVQGYALARPEVRFEVSHDGRTVLEAPAVDDGLDGLRQRIRQIFGPGLADELVEVRGEEPGLARIEGLVGTPATARRRPFVFVNGRMLRDRLLLATYYRAVRDEWQSDRFPALFLFVEVPPEDLDVNVHPQKSEVRFRNPAVTDLLSGCLRRTLARIRGEAPAPLREVSPSAPPALAWEGLGGRTEGGMALEPPVRDGVHRAPVPHPPARQASRPWPSRCTNR